MVTYYCINTSVGGGWANAARWSLTPGGAAAGAYPVAGDIAYIQTGYFITATTDVEILNIIIDGGILYHASGKMITFDDAAGAGMSILNTNSGGYISQGTAASPATMRSASTSPTNMWALLIGTTAAVEARTLTFSYLILQGCKGVLGNLNSTYVYFNDTATTAGPHSGRINEVTPPMREPILVEHTIDGRRYSRVYHNGSRAGISTVSGYCRIDSYLYTLLAILEGGTYPISFVSDWVVMPRCRLATSPKFRPLRGIYVRFTIQLMEAL